MITRRILTLLWASSLALASACTSLDDPDERADEGDPDSGSGDGGAEDSEVPDDSAPEPGADADAPPDGTVPPPDGTVPPNDNAPPEVTIDFPTPGVTALERVRARGSVSDPDGDAITVVINGVEAELDGDSWTAEVPLAEGENDLTPEASDEHGASAAGESVIVERVGEQLVGPRSCAFDAPNDRMLILETKPATATTSSISVLYALDLETDRITLLSGRGRGQGPEFSAPTVVVHDAEGERAFVLDRDLLVVFEVDLASGDRSILSSANDSAPAFSDPSGIAFDAEGGRLFVWDGGANALFAIDADTGARSVLSDAADGPAMFRDASIAYDPENDVVIGVTGLAIDVIDLADGARTRVGDPDDIKGYKPNGGSWNAVVADPANDRVLLRTAAAIAELDLESHSRTLLADPALADYRVGGDGGCGLAIDPATGDAVILSNNPPQVVRVPLTVVAGETTLSGALKGDGPQLDYASIVLNGDQLIVTERWDGIVAAVDIATGDRTVISDATTGTGPVLDDPTSISFDGINNRAFVLDGPSLVAVDMTNGNRTLISSEWQSVGTGPAIGYPSALAPYWDDVNNRMVLVSGNQLLAIDLANGNRSELSGPSRGTGHLPDEFRDLIYDYAARRYVVISDDDQVLGIDATTGDRSVISGSMAGTSGPALENPYSITSRYDHYSVLIADDTRLISIDLLSGERRLLQNLGYVPFDLTAYPEGQQAILALSNELATVELAGRAFETLYSPPQRPFTGFIIMQELASRMAYSFMPYSSDPGGIAVLDLDTGESETLPGDVQSATGWLTMLMLDPAADRLYGFGTTSGLIAWDLSTGSATPISNASLGQGPAFQFPAGGAIDTARMRLLVIDGTLKALLGVDLETGDRENLSGGPVGTGDDWVAPNWIQYDAEADRAIVLESDRLVAVDLETGARTTLSGNAVGAGAAFTSASGLVLDTERRRAIVRDLGSQAFVAVDLETGDRSRLAPDPKPLPTGGLFFPFATALDYDASRRTIFALDVGFQGALLEIDEFTGDWVAPLGRVY